MRTLRRFAALVALVMAPSAFADGITYDCSKVPDTTFKPVATLWIDGDTLTCSITEDTKFKFSRKWLEDGAMWRIYTTKEVANMEVGTRKANDSFPGVLILVIRNTATSTPDPSYACFPRTSGAK